MASTSADQSLTAAASPHAGAALALHDVTVVFGAVRALDRVDLEVPYGSITGLIGRNGAGKSTSIRLLTGILQPDSGTVSMFGQPVSEAPLAMRAQSGFLLSQPALFAYLTPRETLRFLAEAYGLSLDTGERRTHDLLAFFELEEAADRLVDGFSTGMQKRLGIAAACIHAPPLLVLDEPFEALDPLIVRKLKRLLVGYVHAGGTVLLSSHLIDTVGEICDRIAILERGRVVVAGRTEEVTAQVSGVLGRGTLEELYAAVVPAGQDIALPWLTEPAKRAS